MSSLVKHSIATAAMLIFSAVFFFESLDYPDASARLPQILIIAIVILALAMFIESVVKQRKASKIDAETSEKDKSDEEKINVKRVLIFGVLIALYIYFIDIVGYFIVTPLFILITLIVLKAAKTRTVIIIAIGFTVFIYALFVMFLHIPVPMGLLAS